MEETHNADTTGYGINPGRYFFSPVTEPAASVARSTVRYSDSSGNKKYLLERVSLAVLAALPRVSCAEARYPLPESCAESALPRVVSLSFWEVDFESP